MALRKGILRNRIERVGIELEGGWNKVPKTFGDMALRLEHDGSVKFEDPVKQKELEMLADKARRAASIEKQNAFQQAYALLEAEIRRSLPRHKGEIPSPPLSMTEWEPFILQCYPDKVNATCGLHVHMSFAHRLNYARIMTPDYMKAILKDLNEWAEEEKLDKDHPIWPRITKPNHDHCAHQYLGDAQVKQRRKDYHSRGTAHSRYTAINYCYAQHKTVECRLLPMMETKEQAVRGVRKVLTSTNQFLAKVRERERKHLISVPKTAEILERYEVQV